MSKIALILITLLLLPSNLLLFASYNSGSQQWEDTITNANQEITYQYNYTETGNSDAYGYFEMVIGSDNPSFGAGAILKITSISDQWNLSSGFGVISGSTTRQINPITSTWSSNNNLNIRFGAQMPVGYCSVSIPTGGCDITQGALGNNIRSINNGTGNGLITIKAQIDSNWIPSSAQATIYTLKTTQGGQIIHPQGYNINPKGWQIKIDLTNPNSTKLRLMLNLAGAYNQSTRLNSNQLKVKNLIPNNSPYQEITPMQYISIPNIAVDWIYLQLLQGGQTKYSKSLMLLNNGDVIDPTNPNQSIDLTTLPSGNYQAIILHRNHLPISTAQDITLSPSTTTNLDLRTNANVKGGNQVNLGNNQFGLKPGNVNDDLFINSNDRVLVRNQKDSANVYSNYDINLDGQISSQDRSLSRLGTESVSML